MEQLGEIGYSAQMLLVLGSAGVPPATFGVLAGRLFAHRFIQGASRCACRKPGGLEKKSVRFSCAGEHNEVNAGR